MMDITHEDVKVCNCCGKPVVEGDIHDINKDSELDEFWVCERCEDVFFLLCIDTKGFVNDMSKSVDLIGIMAEQNRVRILDGLARAWRSFGHSANG